MCLAVIVVSQIMPPGDVQFTASSYSSTNYPWCARMASPGVSHLAIGCFAPMFWAPNPADPDPWIQYDFTTRVRLWGIRFLGVSSSSNFMRAFRMQTAEYNLSV